MIVSRYLPIRRDRPLALSIGSFDGVHRGHVAVLRGLHEVAIREGLEPAVLTFEPLPREYFQPSPPPPRLMRLAEKIPYLQALGMERTIVLRFDARLASTSAEDFITEILVRGLGVRLIAVGEDFRFGHARRGDVDLLRRSGKRYGFELLPITAYEDGGERISSSRIRSALANGALVEAERLLGHPYVLEGRVMHGLGLARRLGYPTANIAPGRCRLALRGVFAVHVSAGETNPYNGVASLGIRPGFGDGRELIEVHLFDYDGSPLYGRRLRVRFVARIRDEWVFESVEALARQIARDVEETKRILAEAQPGPQNGGVPNGG